MHWLFCGKNIHHIECTDNKKHEILLNEQKFTKDQVYYALNLSLLLRITRSIFIGRIYSSACCLLLSQNVSPFSPPKDFTIQIYVFQNTLALNHFLPPFFTEIRDLEMSLVHFSGLGNEAAKCLPNFHPFELDLPTFWICTRTKHRLSNEKLHSKSREKEAVP